MTTEGLTEAERVRCPRCGGGEMLDHAVEAHVERILADRLAAVQAERDEAHEKGYWFGYREGKDEAETRDLNFDTLTEERDAARREERMRAEDQAKAWRIIARVAALAGEADARVVRTAEIRAALDADR